MAEKREPQKRKRASREKTKQEIVEEKKITETSEQIKEDVEKKPEEVAKKEIIPEEMIKAEETKVEVPAPVMPTEWKPKTQLGKNVFEGKITDIDYIFSQGIKIVEPEIVDVLVPNLATDIIFIGGSTGKGGGIRRTPTKRTARMHKSGRRYSVSALVVIGNGNGYVGIGFASGAPQQQREIVQRATRRAKLNLIPLRRGCGSWECGCGESHSIPFTVTGKAGSVRVELKPAPKGIGLCVSDEIKKLMRMAGIKDVWSKTRGQTQSRINQLRAAYDAIQKINKFKSHEEFDKNVALKVGKAE